MSIPKKFLICVLFWLLKSPKNYSSKKHAIRKTSRKTTAKVRKTVRKSKPVSNAKRLDTSDTTASSSESGAYSIMQADSVTKIEELLKDNPHLAWGE